MNLNVSFDVRRSVAATVCLNVTLMHPLTPKKGPLRIRDIAFVLKLCWLSVGMFMYFLAPDYQLSSAIL